VREPVRPQVAGCPLAALSNARGRHVPGAETSGPEAEPPFDAEEPLGTLCCPAAFAAEAADYAATGVDAPRLHTAPRGR
jgi:hypothetical protein